MERLRSCKRGASRAQPIARRPDAEAVLPNSTAEMGWSKRRSDTPNKMAIRPSWERHNLVRLLARQHQPECKEFVCSAELTRAT